MPDATLYLFDGFNVLHAGAFQDVREMKDALASFVALRGARGVVVFDGAGADERIGPLEVRYAADADGLLERLASEYRERERVFLVSSDSTLRGTAGREVAKQSSQAFVRELKQELQPHRPLETPAAARSRLGDRLDPAVREKLERLRRGGH
jgi:predicted RNA-binding protein with PIN domain